MTVPAPTTADVAKLFDADRHTHRAWWVLVASVGRWRLVFDPPSAVAGAWDRGPR